MGLGTAVRRLRDRTARCLACLALLAVLLVPAPLAAGRDRLPGANAPELTAAIDQWLQNEEEVALTAFAGLARGGNAAAQLMLAIIDKTPSLQGPWLARLSRSERIALLREPGGLSGRSWLHALTDVPLGAAWLSLMDPATGPEVIATFAELGEARAAREALVVLAARQHPGLRELDPASVDPDLIYLLWRGADADRQAELLENVVPESAQHALLEGTFDNARLDDWLAEAEAGAPLDAICSEFCTATRATCLTSAYKALASHNALLTLGSPVEALISQERFLAQPRGRSSVLRRILQTHDARGRRVLIAKMRERDACLADVLQDEAARYHYRRPGSESSEEG